MAESIEVGSQAGWVGANGPPIGSRQEKMPRRRGSSGPFGRQPDITSEVIVEILRLGWRRPKMRRMDERQEGGSKDTKSAVLRNGGLDAGCDRVRRIGVVKGHMHFPKSQGDRPFRVNGPATALRAGCWRRKLRVAVGVC